MAAAQRSAAQQRLVRWLGPACELYLQRLADTDRSLARQVRELLELVREYGPETVAIALQKAHAAARSVPTTSATSFANSRCSARCSHGFACKTRN